MVSQQLIIQCKNEERYGKTIDGVPFQEFFQIRQT